MQFLAIALFLCGALQVSFGCSCLYNPLIPFWKSNMCGALKYGYRFGIEAKVIGKRTIANPKELFKYAYYEIELLGNYKKELGTSEAMTRVYTGENSASCGITLETGMKYVLTGYRINPGQLWTGLCDFHRKWKDTTEDQRLFVKNKKSRDCPAPGCFCKYEVVPDVPFWKPQLCKLTNAENGFVITAILGDTKGVGQTEPFYGIYDIKIIGNRIDVTDTSRVYTKMSSGGCDVNLLKGNKYILTGTVEDGKLVMEGCDYYKIWMDATPEEKQYVNNPGQFC